MTVLLLQLDGKLPNLALMRLAAHHRAIGDTVTLRVAGNPESVQPQFGDPAWQRVYASLIFERTRDLARTVRRIYPDAILGGTGWNLEATLEAHGVTSQAVDFADYPRWRQSLGFTQRGCRLNCSFCCVPRKEGRVQAVGTVADLWRGEPWPKEILLLDNDFFGQPAWRARIAEMIDGGYKVSFNQGINARFLTDETAAAVASVDYRDDQMREKRLYTAWDNIGDEARLFAGLNALARHGVRPRHVMVYVLVGYDHATKLPRPDLTPADFYRCLQLRAWGALPYPMPFVRNADTLGFQRWVIGGYDKSIPWAEWTAAHYQPRRLHIDSHQLTLP